jgi:hypothetical protein
MNLPTLDFSLKTKVFLRRIKYPDICLTGGCVMMFFALVGALHQLRRFIALGPEDERKGRSI